MRAALPLLAIFGLSACAVADRDVATSVQCKARAGTVVLNCLVHTDGSLSDCRVLRETPRGCGLAEAALGAAAQSRASIDSNHREGARLIYTIRFALAEGAPPPPLT